MPHPGKRDRRRGAFNGGADLAALANLRFDGFVRAALSNLDTAGANSAKKGERLRFIKGNHPPLLRPRRKRLGPLLRARQQLGVRAQGRDPHRPRIRHAPLQRTISLRSTLAPQFGQQVKERLILAKLRRLTGRALRCHA